MMLSLSTPKSCRHATIALSIALTYFSGSLAFRSAPGYPPPPFTRRFHIVHHGSYQYQGLSSGIISHNGRILMAAAHGDEGYEEWYINEEDGGDNIPDVSDSSSQLDVDDGNKDNDIRTYFATCIPGLQNTLASELVSLGASRVETQGKSGVRFGGSPKVGLKSILWCRTAHKIMELVASSTEPPPLVDELDFDYRNECDFSRGIRNGEDLYQFTKSAVHTPTLLGDGRGGLLTLSVSTIYASKAPKELCHGHFTALTVKNALVDAVRELREDGDRPNVDVEDSDVPLVVVIRGRRVSDGRGRDRRERRGRRSDDGIYEEEEFVADVDLYRCLHSGGSLHRRGYRQGDNLDIDWEDEEIEKGEEDGWEIDTHNRKPNSEAPIHRAAMKESLAAGLLMEAGWDKLINASRGDGMGAVLIDPMTGSGTLPTEAALIACDMAPGLLRIASWRGNGRCCNNPHRCPPCVRWKDFGHVETWDALVAKATQRAKSGIEWARSPSGNVKILCNEKNPRAVRLAQASIRNAGVSAIVTLGEGDCLDWVLGGDEHANDRNILEGRTMFVCNPPWGLRLTQDIDESWVSLREFLRREAGGCESWVLSGNKYLTKILRMRKSRTVVVKTADEDLRWLQYHVFSPKAESIQKSIVSS